MSFLERIFFFHQETRQNRFPNSRSLAKNFEISIATAKRDISYLRDRLLAPLAFDTKKSGYYYTEETFHLPFEESPRIVFLLAMLNKLADEAGLGGLQEVRQLEQRLATLISPEYGKLVDSLQCQWIEVETIDHQIFATIIEGVVKKRLLAITYRPIGGNGTARTVAPLQLINHQGRWYLFAFCQLRRTNRLFHIARIQSATVTRQPLPLGLDVDNEHLMQSFGIFQGAPRYLAEILFSSTAADLVANQYWHKDQVIKRVDGGVVIQLPVNDDRELVMKILQYGAMARVLAPPELVQRVSSTIEAMAEIYQ
jgi:predicted DNA-binding transcriptional regulator YafY